MDLPDVPLMSMLRTRMSWLHQRQDVLSQNVANADTPGFVARDLKPLDFNDTLHSAIASKGNNLTVTDPHHIAIRSAGSTKFDDVETRDIEANPNGNAVSLESQMIKVSDTQAQFQAAANLYAKALTMMKTAIGH
jgi:flagellar basal-body rod protein FlgB